MHPILGKPAQAVSGIMAHIRAIENRDLRMNIIQTPVCQERGLYANTGCISRRISRFDSFLSLAPPGMAGKRGDLAVEASAHNLSRDDPCRLVRQVIQSISCKLLQVHTCRFSLTDGLCSD